MTEGRLPRLEQRINEHREAEQRKAEQAQLAEQRKREEREARNAEVEYLKNSPVAELLQEAGRMLMEANIDDVHLSVTSPDTRNAYPIDIKLAWDIFNREDRRRIVSDDMPEYIYEWKEVSASVVRDQQGNVSGFKFNADEDSHKPGTVSNLSPKKLAEAVDRAAIYPLRKKQLAGSSFSLDNGLREKLPLLPPKK